MALVFCDRCSDTVGEECDPLDELAQLDPLLERLTLKRYDLKRKINRFHSPIVRQLPPDIMSTIFEFSLPDFADPYTSRSNSLSLGAICSYWREIAWSTPYLWSLLAVEVKSNKLDAVIAQEWLARSGQLPLSIRIISAHRRPNKTRQGVSALAEIINQYSTRWSNFDLLMPRSFYQFFRATDNHAPNLRSIRFHTSQTDAPNFQLTCPRLERADLSSFQIDGTNIQWDNLTHLILQRMTFSDSFFIMSKTRRLVFCQISSPYEIGVPSLPRIILESLRTLHFSLYDNTFAFLDHLITPCLEELSISEYPESMGNITSLFERSACSLRSFSVTFNVSNHFEEFMSLLPLIPSLKTLSITAYTHRASEDDSRNIVQLVAKVVSSQCTTIQRRLLPNLEVLEYTGRIRPGNYAELFPLPPTDNTVHGPLRLLKLDLSPIARIPENIISYLLSLTERGDTVNVLSGSKDILQSSVDYYRDKEESLCPGLG